MAIRSIMAALLLAACATPQVPTTPPQPAQMIDPTFTTVGSVARGGAFVTAQCAGCHAVGPTGSSPLAAAPPLRELNRRYPVEQLDEAFAEGFVTTHSTMPEFVLDVGQNRDLIAYLTSIQTNR